MSEALVREIAEQVAKAQGLSNLWVLALVALVSIVASALGAFAVSYLNKRGETLATKADIGEVLAQLQQTTRTAEAVKAAIQHDDWISREWKTLQRVKLEAYLTAIYETIDWLDLCRQVVSGIDDGPDPPNSPLGKATQLVELYFPQFRLVHLGFCEKYTQMFHLYLDVRKARLEGQANKASYPEIGRLFGNSWVKLHRELLQCRSSIEGEARSELKRVLALAGSSGETN